MPEDAVDTSLDSSAALVPSGTRVVAVGAADGPLADELRGRGCDVVPIEPDAVDSGEEGLEAVLLEGTLERATDPHALLGRIRAALADDGCVIVSVRNVAHADVRLALLDGDFLLEGDSTRAFTREGLRNLLESAGYVATTWRRERRDSSRHVVDPALGRRLDADGEATTYRFVVRAVPANEAARLRELHRELQDARAALAERDERLAAAERRLGEADAEMFRLTGTPGTAAELEAMAEREDELRALLLDAQEQLLRRDEELERLAMGTVRAQRVVLRRQLAERYPVLTDVYRRARARISRPG